MSASQDLQTVSDYPDVLNPDLLDRIPLDAEVILDVGCHKGMLGAVYRLRNPRARVLGVDNDIAAVRVAATRLSQVACLNIETDPLPFEVPGGYDCIIYGDVLEHLRDPWRVMREHAALLSPRGVMLICVPNVAHWSISLRLLNGTFDYEESGVLDRTHLRWFTLASMEKALLATGPAALRCHAADLRPAGRRSHGRCLQGRSRRYRRFARELSGTGSPHAICLAGPADAAKTRSPFARPCSSPMAASAISGSSCRCGL